MPSRCRTFAGSSRPKASIHVYEGDMTDWSDTFDWIGTQPWSTGRIGTYGCSYLGEGQIVAAQQRHPRHIAAIPQAAGGNIGRVGRRREFWGSVEGGAFSMSINFGWMPVFASTDKGARPMPNVDLADVLQDPPVIDMTDRAGSPSWDWRNFLERSPDDPWWDKQGYLTADDSRERRRAARVVVVRHGGGGARGSGDLPQERAERPGEDRAIRDHLADGALRVRGRVEPRRRSAISRSATPAFTTGRRISRGSIAGSRATSTRSIRSPAFSTT